MRKLLVVPLAAVLAAVLATGAAGPQRPSTVTIRLSHDPDTLNPLLSGMAVSQEVSRPVLAGLLTVDDRLRFQPDLAVAVPTVRNGGVTRRGENLVVTYRLRKGVRWHDGRPFTSRDVAFTWRFALRPDARVIDRTGYDRILGVETPAPDLARVVFKGVYAPYIKLFRPVLPAHVLEREQNPNSSDFNMHPVGTGPYKVAHWRPGDRLRLDANDDYYGGRPKVDRLVFMVVPDDNAAFVRFKGGDLDVYQSVALSHIPLLRDLPGVVLPPPPELLYEPIARNPSRPPLSDLAVRRAVALAIDKDEISRTAYGGAYPPAWSDQPPLSWAHDPALGGRTDPTRARALLEAAGWRSGPGGIRVKDGRKLGFTLLTTSGKKPRELAALLIRQDLRKVGIEVMVQTVPGSVLFGPTGPLKKNAFDAAMWAWDTDVDPDPTSFWHSGRIPPHGSNVSRYRNAELDRLLDQAANTIDRAVRKRLYLRASRILRADVPDVPLLYWNLVSASRVRLQGWRPGPAGALWNCAQWRVIEPVGNAPKF